MKIVLQRLLKIFKEGRILNYNEMRVTKVIHEIKLGKETLEVVNRIIDLLDDSEELLKLSEELKQSTDELEASVKQLEKSIK